MTPATDGTCERPGQVEGHHRFIVDDSEVDAGHRVRSRAGTFGLMLKCARRHDTRLLSN